MSGHRLVWLQCDGDPCKESGGRDFDLSLDPGPLAYQRKRARRHGWKVSQPGGKDFCPDCVSDGEAKR